MIQSTNSVSEKSGSKKGQTHTRHSSSSQISRKTVQSRPSAILQTEEKHFPTMPTSLSPILRGQSLSHVIQRTRARSIMNTGIHSKLLTERDLPSPTPPPQFFGKDNNVKKQEAPKLSARARLANENRYVQGQLRTSEDIINQCTRAVSPIKDRSSLSPNFLTEQDRELYNKNIFSKRISQALEVEKMRRNTNEGSQNFLELNGFSLSKGNIDVPPNPELQKIDSLIEKLQTRIHESNNTPDDHILKEENNNSSPQSKSPKKRRVNRLKEKNFDKFSFDELLRATKNANYRKLSKTKKSDTFTLVDTQFADTFLLQNSPRGKEVSRPVTERYGDERRHLQLNLDKISPDISPSRAIKGGQKSDRSFKLLNYVTPTPQNGEDFGTLQELDAEYEQLDDDDDSKMEKQNIFVSQPGAYFEVDPSNKKLSELKQLYESAELALNPNPQETLAAKIEKLKHDKFIKDYKFNELPENITIGKKGILQPVFMQKAGSMCFTELWNNNERRKVAKVVVNEIKCVRIANPEREGELLYRPAKWRREAELKKQIQEQRQKHNYVPIKSVQNDKAHLREYAEHSLKYLNSSPISNRGFGNPYRIEGNLKDTCKSPGGGGTPIVYMRSMSSPKFSRADSPISMTKTMRESPTLFTKMMRAESRMKSQKPRHLLEPDNLSSTSKNAFPTHNGN